MMPLKDRDGFVKGFLSLLVLAAIVYAGIEFGKPYYRYNTLRSHTKDTLLMDVGNVDAIREKVLADATELGIPLEASNLEVKVKDKIITVTATWSETVDFWGYYQKQLDFNLEVEY